PKPDFALIRYGPSGRLDGSFGAGGKVRTKVGSPLSRDYVYGVAVQPDGKIIAAGECRTNGSSEFPLVRYEADGSLDRSFGFDGEVLTDLGRSSGAFAVAVESTGKVLAAGAGGDPLASSFALAQYNPDGSLDPTFGEGGKVQAHFVADDSELVTAVALQHD